MKVSNELMFRGMFTSISEAMLHPECNVPGSVILLNNKSTYVLDDNNTWHLLNYSHSERNKLLSAISYYENKAKYDDQLLEFMPEPDPEAIAHWLSEYERSVDWSSAEEDKIVCQSI